VRQEQRETEGNKAEPGSQSSFKAVVHLAEGFGSLPVPSLNPASLIQPHGNHCGVRVTCFVWDTHAQSKKQSG